MEEDEGREEGSNGDVDYDHLLEWVSILRGGRKVFILYLFRNLEAHLLKNKS